jgi:hypothetical protein
MQICRASQHVGGVPCRCCLSLPTAVLGCSSRHLLCAAWHVLTMAPYGSLCRGRGWG